MRNLVFFIATCLLFFATSAAASDVWACQGNESRGFNWSESRWAPAAFQPRNFLLKLEGMSSTNTSNGRTRPMSCLTQAPNEVVCIDEGVATTFALNTKTGTGGRSTLFGTVDVGNVRDHCCPV